MKMRRETGGQKGFTLIELLIVIAIIGLIAAMLIPNLLDAMQKTKQKRTMADMRITGTALFSWLTDEVGAAAAGQANSNVVMASYGSQKSLALVASILVPQYLQDVPTRDGWKFTYEYYVKTEDAHARQVMLIRSRGRNNVAEGTTEYTVTSFDPTDYDQDIVWADGFMVRWPQKS